MSDASALQEDVRDLLLALGLSDHARPISCHEVVRQEILPEVQRLTAELALKDQALDEIKHALESGTWPGYGLTVERIQCILTRLDTQGETK